MWCYVGGVSGYTKWTSVRYTILRCLSSVVCTATQRQSIPCIIRSYRTECGKMRKTYWINNTSTLNMFMCENCMTLYEVPFREIPLMWNSICIGCGVETRTQLWIRRMAQLPIGVYDD